VITNTGKNILSKFLISQAPAYASYIAIGCGPKPLSTPTEENPSGDAFDDYSDYTELDFEMLRLPIVSRGYISEYNELTAQNDEKIVFTAELPTEERYEITEVGVYSAGGNPSAVGFDSRMLYTFSENEGWEYVDVGANTTEEILLETGISTNNVITTTSSAFFFTSTNALFANANRISRYERPRILNGSLAIVGNNASLSDTGPGSEMTAGVGSDYIKLTGTSVNLNKNAPTDKLKLAFSVMNRDGNEGSDVPDLVEIMVRFASSANPAIYANMQISVPNGTGSGQHNFANNRYVVVEKQLQELYYRTGFSWGVVDQIEIYASVTDSGSESSDYYVALDGIRLDNTTTQNPLYGLTGYTVFKTENAETVIKNRNTKNYIEFRFGINVGV
jgi:hypothetical protein